ncbi:polysaccharide deacetylase family protein [Steroidobacter sp.]|uniref:polysaccharide deacetylase family protein n=1 Tax=Steroidobacter sp. TaxID=1978227 RepID=UPI001A3725C8|nr:polysaccharide deacetylase family protein [Steroidobacter sp.]MBL8268388.1 polysaccharide deacetylase family protein [Steroidobacter sp.]
MSALKRLIKNALVAGAYHTGLLQLLLRLKLRDRAVALTYHRVLPAAAQADSFSTGAIVVTPATFRRHMQLLRRAFNPLTADQFAAALAAGKLPPRACIVTFDDGWLDNLEHALPILQECSVPAVLFIATDYIGTDRCFWQETLARALFAAAGAPDRSTALFAELGDERVPKLPPAEAKAAIRRLIDRWKSQPQEQIDALLARVQSALQSWGVTVPATHPDRFLSWAQVNELHASGVVTIGSHCRTHTPLTKLKTAQVSEELQSSRQIIRDRSGVDPLDMAYPNGDHDAGIAAAVSDSGYRTAFTTVRGHVTPDANAFTLRRINIAEQGTDSPGAFLARIAGIF